MLKRRGYLRITSLIALLALLCGPLLGGCKPADATDTVNRLLDCLQKREYPRIYQLLTEEARKTISLVDLSARYEQIFTTLGLQKTVCKLTDVQDKDTTHKLAHFKMTLTAEKLGQFDLEMEAPLALEGNRWLVEWTPELILPGMQEGDTAQLRVVAAERGEIFDKNGEILAKNDHALSVYVDTSKVLNYETLIRELAPKLDVTEDSLRKMLAPLMRSAGVVADGAGGTGVEATPSGSTWPGASPTPSPSPTATPTAATAGASPSPTASAEPRQIMRVVKAYPKGALSEEQQAELKAIPGVGIDTDYMTRIRTYPHGNTLAHALGYTGVLTAEEQKKPENANLPQDAIIGKAGLEKAFETQLRGQSGYSLVIVGKDGQAKTTIASKPAVDGMDLRLTIDIKLQQRAETALMQYLTPQMAGSVVILDPSTGYIQALASAPAYDPNIFSFPVDSDVWKALNDPVNQLPLYNRATDGRYPPGSTFKPFTATMGLMDGKITPGFVFTGKIVDNTWTPDDDRWIYPPIRRKDSYSGPVNLLNAITYSDNIYFAYTAMQVGSDAFYQHCLDFGIGEPMKFDLPLATSQIANGGKIESLRTLADSGYGQGELLITPVQMASLFGSLANNGDIMVPRLVEKICRTDGPRYVADKTNPPEVWKQAVVSGTNLGILLPDLKKVAQIGSAKALNVKSLRPYEICAKTGTAEVGVDKTREIAWLMAFNTQKKDEMNRLVAVSIEVPAGKGGIRTDIAKELLKP